MNPTAMVVHFTFHISRLNDALQPTQEYLHVQDEFFVSFFLINIATDGYQLLFKKFTNQTADSSLTLAKANLFAVRYLLEKLNRGDFDLMNTPAIVC